MFSYVSIVVVSSYFYHGDAIGAGRLSGGVFLRGFGLPDVHWVFSVFLKLDHINNLSRHCSHLDEFTSHFPLDACNRVSSSMSNFGNKKHECQLEIRRIAV